MKIMKLKLQGDGFKADKDCEETEDIEDNEI